MTQRALVVRGREGRGFSRATSKAWPSRLDHRRRSEWRRSLNPSHFAFYWLAL